MSLNKTCSVRCGISTYNIDGQRGLRSNTVDISSWELVAKIITKEDICFKYKI